MRLNLVSIAVIFSLLALLIFRRPEQASPDLQQALLQSQKQLSELTLQLEELRSANAALKKNLEYYQNAPSTAQVAGDRSNGDNTKAKREEQSIRQRFLDSNVQSSIENVAEVVDLSEADKERLTQALRDAWTQEGVEPKKVEEIVSEVLDPERSAQFSRVSAERQKKAETDETNMRVATISRALGLLPEQELVLRGSIAQIEEDLAPKKEELKSHMRTLHSSKASTQERIQQFEQFKQSMEDLRMERRRLLAEKLQPTLTKAQFDKLVNEQASAPDGLFGLSNF